MKLLVSKMEFRAGISSARQRMDLLDLSPWLKARGNSAFVCIEKEASTRQSPWTNSGWCEDYECGYHVCVEITSLDMIVDLKVILEVATLSKTETGSSGISKEVRT